MQKMSDKPLTRCKECKGKLEKIFSQTSFQLKGSGWYVSDYGKSGKTEKADKPDKADKADKVEKVDKPDKAEKTEKKETTTATA
jgi:predicted nucleic acid-binding Zn ribbon protein